MKVKSIWCDFNLSIFRNVWVSCSIHCLHGAMFDCFWMKWNQLWMILLIECLKLIQWIQLSQRLSKPILHQLHWFSWYHMGMMWLNSPPPGQNARYFTDYIFKCIFMFERFCILIEISLKFVPKGPINNKSALVWGNGLVPARQQAITPNNADPVDQCIYAALGGDELTQRGWNKTIFKCILMNENVCILIPI